MNDLFAKADLYIHVYISQKVSSYITFVFIVYSVYLVQITQFMQIKCLSKSV